MFKPKYTIVCESYFLPMSYVVMEQSFTLWDLTLWLPYTLVLLFLEEITGQYDLTWNEVKRFSSLEEAFHYIFNQKKQSGLIKV